MCIREKPGVSPRPRLHRDVTPREKKECRYRRQSKKMWNQEKTGSWRTETKEEARVLARLQPHDKLGRQLGSQLHNACHGLRHLSKGIQGASTGLRYAFRYAGHCVRCWRDHAEEDSMVAGLLDSQSSRSAINHKNSHKQRTCIPRAKKENNVRGDTEAET